MSTATAADYTGSISPPYHFLLRRLHSLTGILFGGYIIIHLLVNATLIQGGVPNMYQMQVAKIHSLPFLIPLEWAMIFLPIIYHTVYGLWMTFNSQPNVRHYPYAKNWFWLFQRLSALLLVVLIAFHVLGMKGVFGAQSVFTFNDQDASATAIRHITTYAFVSYVVYPLFVLCACYHLANGFWTAGITWGLTISAGAQRRWGLVCFGLFLFTYTCGMLSLVAVWTHRGTI